MGTSSAGSRPPAWFAALRRFEVKSPARVACQLANSLIPYLLGQVVMGIGVHQRWPWYALAGIALATSGFMVRTFILFHDCVHGSLLASPRAERVLGRVLGVLTFTPFGHWRHEHLGHHATAGDLDRRGIGDVWTLTVEEYLASPRRRRLWYAITRNPFFLMLFGPLLVFVVAARIPPTDRPREQVLSVLYTDAALAIIAVVAAVTVGLRTYLLVELPVVFFGGAWGLWLFYVQHQFDPSYFARGANWGWLDSALRGSSYFKLPRLLQWFSGNIGLHHVHHLRPHIPNYNLQACLDATPALQAVKPLTFLRSLRCSRLALWDEPNQAFTTLRAARRRAAGGDLPSREVAPTAS